MLQTYQPTSHLAPFVHGFWRYKGSPVPYARERVLPSGALQIVFNLDHNKLSVFCNPGDQQAHNFTGALLCGPQTQPCAIPTAQQTNLLGIAFAVGGAFPFLPLPADAVQNAHVDLADVWGAAAVELHDKVRSATSAQAQFRLLEQALLCRLHRPPVRHKAVAYALRSLQSSASIQRVAALSEKIGLSARHFRDVFQREVGLTPKQFTRVQRFQHVLRAVAPQKAPNWADVALSYGYYDQAHLIGEFHACSGLTPTAYQRQRLAPGNHVPLR